MTSSIRPNLFIVGAPKCGTSSVHHYLADHPSIFMASAKELYYFCPDIRSVCSTESSYLAHFHYASAASFSWRGESTPLYLVSRVAASRIREYQPAARIIILLRNPVDTMHALHAQRLYNGVERHTAFETAVQDQEILIQRHGHLPLPGPGWKHFPSYREVAYFAPQVKRYLDTFPASQVRVILFEELQDSTEATVSSLYDWLGLESVGRTGQYERHGSRRHFLPPIIQYGVRWLRPLVHHARRMAPNATERLKRPLLRLARRSHAPLAAHSRAKLLETLADEITELEALLDRSLDCWREPSASSSRRARERLLG